MSNSRCKNRQRRITRRLTEKRVRAAARQAIAGGKIREPRSEKWSEKPFPPVVLDDENPWTDEMIALLARPAEELIAELPEEEQQKYRDAQQSVVDARRAGERLAHEMWIA